MPNELVAQGIEALKAGDKLKARQLFISAIKQNPNNEEAWYGIYNAVENNEQRIRCLQEILRINPANEKASQMLEQHQASDSFLNDLTQKAEQSHRVPPQPSIQTAACSSCGAPLNVPPDTEYMNCSYCGASLSIQRSDGSIALKLVEKVSQAIQASGTETKAVIQEGTSVTRNELRQIQLRQDLSTAQLQYSTTRAEIRTLEREKQTLRIMKQLRELRATEVEFKKRIRILEETIDPTKKTAPGAKIKNTGCGCSSLLSGPIKLIGAVCSSIISTFGKLNTPTKIIVISSLVFLCIICTVIGLVADSTPSAQATKTERANKHVTDVANAALTATEAARPTSTPTPILVVVLPKEMIGKDNVSFTLEQIDVLDSLGDNKPKGGKKFIVLLGQLHNSGNDNTCVKGDTFILRDGNTEYKMSDSTLKLTKEKYKLDYPGLYIGQCIDPNETVDSFLVFEVLIDAPDLWLRFSDTELQLGQMYYLLNPLSTYTPTVTSTPTITPPPTLTFTPSPSPIQGVVKSEILNVRAGPGQNYAVITQVEKNDSVNIVARNQDGTWLYVKVNEEQMGWISTANVQTTGDINSLEISDQIIITPTKQPTVGLTSTPGNLIVDVKRLIGVPVKDAEKILGKSILITPNDDNDDTIPGGEYRDYMIGKYQVYLMIDKNGISRGFQVFEGLSDENYSINDWKTLLPRFGINITVMPDRTALAAMYWCNVNGYGIAIFSETADGRPVWTVLIMESAFFMHCE